MLAGRTDDGANSVSDEDGVQTSFGDLTNFDNDDEALIQGLTLSRPERPVSAEGCDAHTPLKAKKRKKGSSGASGAVAGASLSMPPSPLLFSSPSAQSARPRLTAHNIAAAQSIHGLADQPLTPLQESGSLKEEWAKMMTSGALELKFDAGTVSDVRPRQRQSYP